MTKSYVKDANGNAGDSFNDVITMLLEYNEKLKK